MSAEAAGSPLVLTAEQRLYIDGIKAKDAGDLQKAIECFQKAIELAPNVPAYRLNFAVCAAQLARATEPLLELALLNAQEACKMDPLVIGNWIVLGEVCLNVNRFPEAIAAYEKTLEINPKHAFIWGLLGFAYGRNGQLDNALMACEKAVEIDPELGSPHFLLSGLYYERYFDPKKMAHHGERGFTCQKPSNSALESMWNAAHGFLILGDYLKGWNYYEARLRRNQTNVGQMLPTDRYPGKPLWRGEDVKTLLVQTEMGFGDAFVMLRYLTMLTLKGIEVIFECPRAMIDLIQHNYPQVKCVPFGKVDPTTFDAQIPILSLPFIFETKSYTVPWAGPYIQATDAKKEEWQRIRIDGKLNIGVCWFSGRNSYSADNHHTSKRKSLTFEQIKPLLDPAMGVNFISLQIDRDDQFKNPGIKDFSDTAALIALCDVVVTVDTAVANLAGAMGANVWLMDRYDHDWRWSEIATPWFPTVTVYRQTKERNWVPVVEKIKSDLSALRDKMTHGLKQ